MPAIFNAVIRKLVGDVDGVNKIFATSSTFVAGTFRIVVNGQVYESDDDEYGWTEIDTMTVEMAKAPLVDDVLQAFYQDAEGYTPNLDNVIGTPFDPDGILP